ncbi:MAG: ABC transporter permease [Candidatus Lokiarchaeota archaeon]|nr:ABC transporter permease [Candidatus Lokiarchaeota archaeon]
MKHKDMKAILLATRNSLSRIWALLRNEIESLLKDKQSLLIIFLLPLAVMLPFKFTNIGEAKMSDISVFQATGVTRFGVLDFDTTDDWPGTPPIAGAVEEDLSVNFSRTFHFIMAYGSGALGAVDNTTLLMEEIRSWFLDYPDGTFFGQPSTGVEIVELADRDEGIQRLSNGEIIGFMIIPYGFERNITARVPAEIIIVSDATETGKAATIVANLELAIAAFKLIHNLLRDEIFPIPNEVGKPNNSPLFDGGPLIFSILIFGGGLLLASQCIVGDEPLRRTLLTPAGKLEVVLAKTGALSAIYAVQVQLILLVAIFGFDLPVLGDYYVPFLMLFMQAFCGAMIGMFISVISKTRLQANQFFLLVFIVFLLALIFVTNDDINLWMPMYQGVDGFTTYAYKGFGFALQPWPIMSVTVISLAFLGLTILAFYFKKTIE